ncbi:aminomethyl-transferring glycine dehydrogenase subunit GcvPA [Leptolinea tardivitalis]|uniref:Probable glycine dehydrogenase (decarboxylating) subunit 1 n=1 Tax=Leptolinea tardivitalis TaxID=229920 RepID=A0A0P6WTC7_9CHLR|nr:aminomethyl-transferring glycine dehydrogenase subunit GcvPA [Leptolinea tardivitalis]KPL72416.1 glycine dehydrogenase [Leptolinea tardivitalis]GAP22745.1 glycine dehydrogenase (decarboxylating) alpha subunit [Leptolinea tardivitalis]
MFTPHTNAEREEMLRAVGVSSIEDLFKAVPKKYRFPSLDLPPKKSELEITNELSDLSNGNGSVKDLMCFLGAGAYHHFIPAAVDSIISRGEFFTAYTPYQPEISQGTLQAIFEYQSLIANLTGMDACNASHYDGATAVAEAVILAHAHYRGKRPKMILSPSLNPQYRETVRTYTQGFADIEITGDLVKDPLESPDSLIKLIDMQTALVVVQYPDFFGRIYDYAKVAEVAHQNGALFAVSINPIALGLLKPPSEFGADIVVGEGQPLGIPLSLGGPYLGLFATKKELVRKISGRLVGETVDQDGKRGYVLTLTAREQHIRREKATSNICSNQGLMALASSVYLSLLGKQGLRQVAELCYQKAHYAAGQISTVPGFSVRTKTPFFHEFIVDCPVPVAELNAHLLEHGILGGFELGTVFPSLKKSCLIAVTEMNTKDDIDIFVEVLKEMSHD